MGWAFMSVRLSHLYRSVCKTICPKEIKEAEELEVEAKQALRT
jgi:hypothetical protein